MRDLYLLTGVLVGSRLVCDKQILNHSIITSVSNSKHESTAHVTAHVKDLVLTIVAEMSRQIISQIQRLF